MSTTTTPKPAVAGITVTADAPKEAELRVHFRGDRGVILALMGSIFATYGEPVGFPPVEQPGAGASPPANPPSAPQQAAASEAPAQQAAAQEKAATRQRKPKEAPAAAPPPPAAPAPQEQAAASFDPTDEGGADEREEYDDDGNPVAKGAAAPPSNAALVGGLKAPSEKVKAATTLRAVFQEVLNDNAGAKPTQAQLLAWAKAHMAAIPTLSALGAAELDVRVPRIAGVLGIAG